MAAINRHLKISTDQFQEMALARIDRWADQNQFGISKDKWSRARDAQVRICGELPNHLLLNQHLKCFDTKVSQAINAEFAGDPQQNEICSRVRQLYRDVFFDHNQSETYRWPNQEKKRFLETYQAFLRQFPECRYAQQLLGMLMLWGSDETNFNLNDVNVTRNPIDIYSDYLEFGVIQIRDLDPHAEMLIIGCGHGRISNDGNTPFNFQDSEEREYSLAHNHSAHVDTLGLGLDDNPNVIGCFDEQSVSPIFRGKKYRTIVFEGFFPPDPRDFTILDLKELLAEDGKIYVNSLEDPDEVLTQADLVNEDELEAIQPMEEALVDGDKDL